MKSIENCQISELKLRELSLLKERKKVLARNNLSNFIQYTKDDYEFNWHHVELCDKLERFVRGDIKRLMVFAPPQTGKSEIVSRRLPAYILGNYPSARVVACSYSSDLAQRFNQDVQRIMDEPSFKDLYPDSKVGGDGMRRTLDIFEMRNFGGSYKAVGVGGPLTGSPCDIGIIDDPVKDSLEALSPTYRERVWNWYTDVFSTRLHNDSQVLLTMTRWHGDDLAGRILATEGEEWETVTLEAIKTRPNPFDDDFRDVGEVLWGERHSLERMEKIRDKSKRTFEALYQQNPKPQNTGGEFYKSFRYELHVNREKYDPAEPLHISFDENVNPYQALIICQVKDKTLRVIDEICLVSPRNTLKHTCQEFINRYGDHDSGGYIYGDSTSKKSDVKLERGHNFYTLIQGHLKEFRFSMRVPASNPSVVLRGAFMNEVFEYGYSGLNISIDPSCKNMVEDLTYLKESHEGKKHKNKVKNPQTGVSHEEYGHTSDCLDYAFVKIFTDEYVTFRRGDADMEIETWAPMEREY